MVTSGWFAADQHTANVCYVDMESNTIEHWNAAGRMYESKQLNAADFTAQLFSMLIAGFVRRNDINIV